MAKKRQRSTPKRPYDDPRWAGLRVATFDRDKGECQRQISKFCIPTGLTLEPKQRNTARLGHVVDWRTNEGAWFADTNLQIECGPCSSAESMIRKQREGWRHCETEIVLVVGPPTSGKSTRAQELKGPDDLVIDFDLLAVAAGSPRSHDHADQFLKIAHKQRNDLIKQAQRGETGAPRVWLISSNPDAETMFPHHRVEIVDPGQEECKRRALTERPERFQGLIDDWYTARAGWKW